MSVSSSPRKLSKKQSLSLLSGSALNKIGNPRNYQKSPVKERVISESTGLIKFSIKHENENHLNVENQALTNYENATEVNLDELTSIKNDQLPIYVPINHSKDDIKNFSNQSQMKEKDILFKMAAKQRTILELSEQLRQAKEELELLETEYKKIIMKNSSNTKQQNRETPKNQQPLNNVASTIRKSTSIMNINQAKINTQEQILKTQKQVTDSFNQFTSNLSNSNFLTKGKSFFEASINKNVQMGTELLNSIFEKDSDHEDSENSEVLVDESNHYDYSVDFDLERLNKINFETKLRGTILEQMEEDDLEDDLIRRVESDFSDEDYGGEVTQL